MDQRGFGESGGIRHKIEKTEDIYNDYWLLIFEAIKKFDIDQQKTPLYLFGRSHGGLIATNMAATYLGKQMFSGICLLTPFYRLYKEKLYNYYPICKFLTLIGRPDTFWKSEYKPHPPEIMAEFAEKINDKRNSPGFTAKTATIWKEEQELAEKSIAQIEVPIMFIEAENDGVVRGDYIQKFAKLARYPAQNEYLLVKEACHSMIGAKKEWAKITINGFLNFFERCADKYHEQLHSQEGKE